MFRRAVRAAALAAFIAGVTTGVPGPVSAAGATTTRESVASSGAEGRAGGLALSMSPDARFVSFWSTSDDLAPNDGNLCQLDPRDPPFPCRDVFVRDRTTGTTTLVSRATTGASGNGDSHGGYVSGDGRYVAFSSQATDLVASDTNGESWDGYVWDRTTGTASIATLAPDGGQFPGGAVVDGMTPNGRYLLFRVLLFGIPDELRLLDRTTGVSEVVAASSAGIPANARVDSAAMSTTGRFVVFSTRATNVDPRATGAAQAVFVRDRTAGTTTLVSGRGVGLTDDRDHRAPTISDDGRTVAFEARSSDRTDAYVVNCATRKASLLAVDILGRPGNGPSYNPRVSADGRTVAFSSSANDLVAVDANLCGEPPTPCEDVFVRNLPTRTTELVSRSSGGQPGLDVSTFAFGGAISPTGRYVLFTSFAPNLVAGDTNESGDVFLRDRGT